MARKFVKYGIITKFRYGFWDIDKKNPNDVPTLKFNLNCLRSERKSLSWNSFQQHDSASEMNDQCFENFM